MNFSVLLLIPLRYPSEIRKIWLSPMPDSTEKIRTAEVQDMDREICTDGRPNDVQNDTPGTPSPTGAIEIPPPMEGQEIEVELDENNNGAEASGSDSCRSSEIAAEVDGDNSGAEASGRDSRRSHGGTGNDEASDRAWPQRSCVG